MPHKNKKKPLKTERLFVFYTDTKLEANLVGQPTVIAQDDDYIYAIVKVNITDTSDEATNVATKDKYDAAVNQLKLLIKKKQDLQGKELLNAFVNSNKSLDEILAFMNGKYEDNE